MNVHAHSSMKDKVHTRTCVSMYTRFTTVTAKTTQIVLSQYLGYSIVGTY